MLRESAQAEGGEEKRDDEQRRLRLLQGISSLEADVTTLWVDVSHHDWNRRGGNMDWVRVRAVTSEVMCARATYGDPAGFSPASYHFADFQAGARAAGFSVCGGYHNLVRGDSASMRRQVDWFRRELDSQACDWAMLDIERYKELVERDLWPRFDDVLRFRDAWHAVEQRPLAYYLPQWLWSGYYGTDLRQLPGPLVQSHYLTGIYGTPRQIYNAGGGDSGTGWDDSYGGRTPDIWQYSATCNVDGASDQTDVNAYRGTVDELRALLTGDDMLTPEDIQTLRVAPWQYKNADGVADWEKNKPGEWYPDMHAVVWDTYRKVQALQVPAPAPVDPAAIKAVLLDPQVLAAIAKAVTDEIAS